MGHVQAGDYKGDVDSFKRFIASYNLDWPVPKRMGYFVPVRGKGRLRYAHWAARTGGGQRVVVHFNGRAEFIERNIYTYKDLIASGYAVWSLDWRGQGLSARENIDDQKHHISSFDQYLADANHFVHNVVKLNDYKGKKILLGHSMGAQVALRLLLQASDSAFDAAVLISPMLRVPDDSWWLRVANKVKKTLAPRSCVWSRSAKWASEFKASNACSLIGSVTVQDDQLINPSETRKYSNDLNKLAQIDCLIRSGVATGKGARGTDLRLACPTSAWLGAAFASTDRTMELAAKLQTPTLIIRAKYDEVVDPAGSNLFCQRSERCTIKDLDVIDGVRAGHELLIETDAIRRVVLAEFAKHVNKTNLRK